MPDEVAWAGNARWPPWWVVLVVLATGLVLVVGATAGAYLRIRGLQLVQADRPQQPSGTAQALAQVSPSLGFTPWQALLYSSACPVPCVGGVACTERPVPCLPGFRCLPGSGTELLGEGESWSLRLSAVVSRAPDGTPLDPCETRRDFWVCLSGTQHCVSQRQACRSGRPFGFSPVGIHVDGARLAGKGIILDLREGGPDGRLLAYTNPIRRLLRAGLCKGYMVGVPGDQFVSVTYFLVPE